jgi:predicted nucleic acid-binding protein
MAVVINAGPLIALSKLNVLHLLKHLYTQVHIPRSVYEETVTEGLRSGYEDARTLHIFLNQEQWATVAVEHLPTDLLTVGLDRGERDALALAGTLNCPLLMDEERGRAVARERGIPVRGTLGVLVEAYQQNLITADQIRLYFAQIAQRSDIWISPTLCRRVLERVLPGDEE